MSSTILNIVLPDYSGLPFKADSLSPASSSPNPNTVGAGPASTLGSFANFANLTTVYAQKIIYGFVLYQMNQQKNIAINGKTQNCQVYISQIYLGCNGDPVEQGLLKPTLQGSGNQQYYQIKNCNANFADSKNTGGFYSPPLIKFFLVLMQLNWEISQGVYPTIPTSNMIQMGLNLYGSKYPGQVWWFNCSMYNTGSLYTNTPTSPTSVPSIVDGIPYDGNFNPPNLDTGVGNAGWNCMQNWFAYVAYCNQILRLYINLGSIKGKATRAMTLNDLNQSNCKYFQISSITADSEGNAFQNIQYLNGSSPQPSTWNFSSVQAKDVNTTVKQLWNKWINQSTTLDPTIIPGTSLWQAPNVKQNLTAPAPRTYMPTNGTFNIPCSLNLTTFGLIKDQNNGNQVAPLTYLGSQNYDCTQYVFNEIYDVNDGPQLFMGANTTPINAYNGNNGATSSVSGAPFTNTYQSLALSNPTAPDNFNDTYGAWDNLVLTSNNVTIDNKGTIQTNAITLTGADPSTGSVKYNSTGGTGSSITAFNAGNVPQFIGGDASPLINNSNFNPWNTYANSTDPTKASQWLISKQYNPVSGQNPDAASLGWCLESSRYDLYHGLFAWNTNRSFIDYSKVVQQTNTKAGVDGSIIWRDCSTGLQGRTSKILKSAGTLYPSAVNGQIYMLSTQSGPFSNNMGVRAQVRTGKGPTVPTKLKQTDLLTFSCPVKTLTTTWPGWIYVSSSGSSSMTGQYYGPNNSNSANVNIPWTVWQYSCGKYDPRFPTSTSFVPNNSTEDNFGIFSDFNILAANYLAMNQSLCSGITTNSPVKYGTGLYKQPLLGLYEMGYLTLSWFDPNYTPPAIIN